MCLQFKRTSYSDVESFASWISNTIVSYADVLACIRLNQADDL